MAMTVSSWPEKYGCDGIDLYIEEGARDFKNAVEWSTVDAGDNLVHFVTKLRELKPKIIICQPTYGSQPQVGGLKNLSFCSQHRA